MKQIKNGSGGGREKAEMLALPISELNIPTRIHRQLEIAAVVKKKESFLMALIVTRCCKKIVSLLFSSAISLLTSFKTLSVVVIVIPFWLLFLC